MVGVFFRQKLLFSKIQFRFCRLRMFQLLDARARMPQGSSLSRWVAYFVEYTDIDDHNSKIDLSYKCFGSSKVCEAKGRTAREPETLDGLKVTEFTFFPEPLFPHPVCRSGRRNRVRPMSGFRSRTSAGSLDLWILEFNETPINRNILPTVANCKAILDSNILTALSAQSLCMLLIQIPAHSFAHRFQ